MGVCVWKEAGQWRAGAQAYVHACSHVLCREGFLFLWSLLQFLPGSSFHQVHVAGRMWHVLVACNILEPGDSSEPRMMGPGTRLEEGWDGAEVYVTGLSHPLGLLPDVGPASSFQLKQS